MTMGEKISDYWVLFENLVERDHLED